MSRAITPDQLPGEIAEILQTFNHNVVTVADEAAVEAAKKAVKELNSISPKRSGTYAKGWTYKKDKTGSVTVYNRVRPGLTHLLEHGHPLRRGGRVVGNVSARPHIAEVEQTSAEDFENLLKEKIQKGN